MNNKIELSSGESVTFPFIASYRGGGYDGCFWEPNFFMVDEKGVFHDLLSSGYRAIKKLEDLTDNHDAEIVELTEHETELNFIHENFVGIVCGKANDLLTTKKVFFKCSHCETKLKVSEKRHEGYPQWFHDEQNYSGNGGVGIDYHSILCEDCFLNRCETCDIILSPEECGECEQCEKERQNKEVET